MEYTEIYKGFTEAELKEAFDYVADPEDWRNAIAATIAPGMLEVTVAAIEFYTATEVEQIVHCFDHDNKMPLVWKVSSVGYRMGPAGP